ncbi:MAG: tRNA preQ1(34) S-adenosylmethionine ribosyltransferase-isomerase QueA [Treponema sp.]
MLTNDFYFDLPKELIAQYPSGERGNDRLLVLDRASGRITDAVFSDLPAFLPPDCLMVFNNTKVRHARVYAQSGASEVEFLLVAPVDTGHTWKVLIKRSKRQKEGKHYTFAAGTVGTLIAPPADVPSDDAADYRYIRFSRCITDSWLEAHGHIPLPPYIKREDTVDDAARYQTIYAQHIGSAAAPTAGLHFTPAVLHDLDERHIAQTAVTLHVGLGTFLPVRSQTIEEHQMHREAFCIENAAADSIEEAHAQRKPIVAVGTTSVRTLESAWNADTHTLRRGTQSTNIFIYPGYRFGLVDALLTNFHTPESTLLMLVCAFAGKEAIFTAYRHAIEHKYRFFSYGDAMLIL